MTQILGPRNAIAYAWFNARGGVKSHAMMMALVAAVLLVLIGLTVSLSRPGDRDEVLSFWAIALLVIQTSSIVLVGGLGVTNAIRQDATSGMHDSMRLMRIPPAGVIMGYITGASSQALNVFVPCAIAGATCSLMGGVGAGPWLWGSALLLTTAFFLLVIAAFVAMMFKQSQMLVVLGAIFLPLGMSLIHVVPGLLMLAGPAAGRGALAVRNQEFSPIVTLCIVSQGAIAALFFQAAAQKFRYPLAPAFGVKGGLRLLAAWAIISGLGLLFWNTVRPRWAGRDDLGSEHFVGTLIAALLVSLVPVVNAARRWGEWRRATALGHPARKPAAVSLTLVATAVIMVSPCVLALGMLGQRSVEMSIFASLLGSLAFCFTLGAVACRAYVGQARYAKVIVGLVAAALLALPLLGDWLLLAFEYEMPRRPLSLLGQFSPIGTFVSAWWEREPVSLTASPLFPGVAAQMVLAAVAWAVLVPRGALRHERQGFEISPHSHPYPPLPPQPPQPHHPPQAS